MSRDERPDAQAARAETRTSDSDPQELAADGSGDDLRSLSAELAPAPASGRDLEEEDADLSALASVGRVGNSNPRELGPGSVSGAPLVRRAAWVIPLAVGLALGFGSGAALFALSRRISPAGAGDASAAPAAGPARAPATHEGSRQSVREAAPAASPPSALAAGPAAAAPVLPAPPETSGTEAVAADTAPARPSAAAERRADASAASARAPAAPKPRPAAARSDAVAAPGEAEPSAAAPAAGGRSMDALLDEALAPRGSPEIPPSTAASDRPPLTPTREDVTKALTVLLPAIRGCTAGQAGLATATLVIRNDGHVASVDVQGYPFAGEASGRCMEGVIRRARFPVFQQASFRVKFPFAVQ